MCKTCNVRFTTLEIPYDDTIRFTIEVDLKGKLTTDGGKLTVRMTEDKDADWRLCLWEETSDTLLDSKEQVGMHSVRGDEDFPKV